MTNKHTCETCKIRVPKNRPLLVCTLCKLVKHYRCNNLSRKEADGILANPIETSSWICQSCYTENFPGFDIDDVTQFDDRRDVIDMELCTVCHKQCSKKSQNRAYCHWCDSLCHKICHKGSLGCLNCCATMIPGYHYDSHDLNGNFLLSTNIKFDPYDREFLLNTIEHDIENGFEDPFITELSDIMNRCSYKEPSNVKNVRTDELRVLYLNVRSLTKHIDEIRENFANSEKYDVLCFCETNCDVDQLPNGLHDIKISGFHDPIVQKPHRASNKGGGLATYVNLNIGDIDSFEKFDLPTETKSSQQPMQQTPCELLFVKINIKQTQNNNYKSYLIGNFYRSPAYKISSCQEYMDSVLAILDKHGNKNITYGGDFNIDLSKYGHDNNCQELIDSCARHNFVQLINRPTRITQFSATIIDHVYTNKVSDVVSTGVVTFDISDHLGVYVTIALHEHRGSIDHEYANLTSWHKVNEENISKFKELLNKVSWSEVHDAVGAQQKYDKFTEIYNKHYNEAFPKSTEKRKNERSIPKPWILPWLEDACARKNKLYYLFVADPTEANKITYDKMDKFVKKHVALAKQKYYTNFFNRYFDCSKKQWQMINNLMGRSKAKNSKITLKDSNGKSTKDPKAVAEKFNDYFSTIADKLKSKIPPHDDTTIDHKTTLMGGVAGSLFLSPTCPYELEKTIGSLKLKCTSDINITTIKAAGNLLGFNEILTQVINSSFEEGIFPEQLKMAKVIPIYKGGSKTEVSNYRPISLLSAFSKIFEKLVHTRVYNFLQKNESLYDMQFGFRAGRSCEHALLTAKNHILSALNKKQTALLLLIDFSKAFDTISHDILQDKLKHYGIRGKAHDWFSSYLQNRVQYVSIDGRASSHLRIKHGVPQGSILGPLLFILYINDLPNISHIVKFIMYADDANIIITADTEAEVIEIFESLSTEIVKWVNINGLFLNLKKTNYMIFTRKKQSILENYIPHIGGTEIKRKHVARFLGVLIDEKLTWNHHIAAIKSKMSRYIGTLYKIKNILPLKARLLSYNCLVQSHVNYCSLIWGMTNKNKIEQLFSAQKKAIRAIMPGNVNYYYKDGVIPTHTKAFFNKHNILTVQNIIFKNAAILMNKVKHFPNTLPSSVLDAIEGTILYPPNGEQPTYLSEWYQTYNTPTYRMTTFFKGPLLYSHLIDTNEWITYDKPKIFKLNVKTHLLLDVQYLGLKDEWVPENFPLYQNIGLRMSGRLKLKRQINYAE